MRRAAAAPRVLLATCARLPEGSPDDEVLPRALAELGVQASWAVWDDPAGGFDGSDLAVLRATWDYTGRRDEFVRWCESVPALANPADVVRWNTDKAYLAELLAAGVPVVPTELVAPGEEARWPDGEFVVKPAVGAGSRDAARFRPGESEAAGEHLGALHRSGRSAVLQPYQESVDREGETALVFFGGVYSHGFVKGPMLVPSSVPDGSGLFLAEGLQPVEPTAPLRRAAEDVLDAACGLLNRSRAELLYARVDLVRSPEGEPLLLELEVSEPSLGFGQAGSGAPLRFASAVRAALR